MARRQLTAQVLIVRIHQHQLLVLSLLALENLRLRAHVARLRLWLFVVHIISIDALIQVSNVHFDSTSAVHAFAVRAVDALDAAAG